VNTRLLLLLAGCVFLGGCGQPLSGPSTLDRYLQRLSGAAEVALDPLPPHNNLAPPRALERAIPPPQQIDLIDFLSLSGCELQINLGRRNSQLGRSASPSQRLLLDLEFMRLAPACADFLRQRQEAALADTIERASKQRLDWLPLTIHQAVLAGPEWQAFWSAPTHLADYPRATDSRIVETLSRLTMMIETWVAGDWMASNRDFELLLSALRAGDGGALLMSMDLVERQLTRANDMLERANRESPLCPFGSHTTRSRAIETVVQQFFIGEVQPWLVRLRQRKELLSAPIVALEAPLIDAQPDRYRDWVRRRDAKMERQARLTRNHVRVIQAALSQCGAS